MLDGPQELHAARGFDYCPVALLKRKDEVWFYVRYPDTDRRTMGDLVKMMIRTSNGVYPLGLK